MGTRYSGIYNTEADGITLLYPQPMLVAEGFSDAAQTIAATSVNTFNAANWSNSKGPFELEFDATGADQSVVNVGGVDVLSVVSGNLELTDQTSTISLPCPAGEHRAAILYEQGAENNAWSLTGTQYASLSTPFQASSGSVEIVFAIDESSTMFLVDGSTADNRGYIYLSLGVLRWYTAVYTNVKVDGISITYDGFAPEIGTTHVLTADVKAFLNIGTIGSRYSAGSFFIGQLYSVKLTDLATPANSQTFTFDGGEIDYTFAEEGGLGDEKVTDPHFNTGCGEGNWTCQPAWTIVNNKAICDNTVSYTNIYQPVFDVDEGDYVQISLTVDPTSTGAAYVKVGDNIASGPYGVGSHTDMAQKSGSNLSLQNRDDSFVGSVSFISIKPLLKAAVFINVVADDWTKGRGRMGLLLDITESELVDFDNSFGSTGDIVIGADSRAVKRWNQDNIDGQRLTLGSRTYLTDGSGNILTDDAGNLLVT